MEVGLKLLKSSPDQWLKTIFNWSTIIEWAEEQVCCWVVSTLEKSCSWSVPPSFKVLSAVMGWTNRVSFRIVHPCQRWKREVVESGAITLNLCWSSPLAEWLRWLLKAVTEFTTATVINKKRINTVLRRPLIQQTLCLLFIHRQLLPELFLPPGCRLPAGAWGVHGAQCEAGTRVAMTSFWVPTAQIWDPLCYWYTKPSPWHLL